MRRPTLTIGLPNFGATYPPGEWGRFVDLARAADDAGIDRVVLVDHVVMGRNTDAYVWGRFPVPPEAPWLEPLTMLAAIAAVTTQVRLATGILVAPLRPAVLLAKQVATLDQLAGGRVDLGVGAGWQREEYDAEGLEFDRRGQLLTDTIAACKLLWTETPASFTSASFTFDDVFCEPKPVQAGGVPVWIAGTLHARNRERIVRHGEGWIPIMGATLDDVRAGAADLRAGFAAAGRDPDSLLVRAPLPLVRDPAGAFDVAASMESVPELLAAGVNDVHLPMQALGREPSAAAAAFADTAERFAAAAQ